MRQPIRRKYWMRPWQKPFALSKFKRMREANGWVDVTAVDEELVARLEKTELEIDYADEDLPDVRDASRLIEVDLQNGEIVVRLTDKGEEFVQPKTGTVGSAGGTAS